MITNSKWSLILRFSFGHIFKFVSQHKLNPSEILSFQGRITGVLNRVYATVFMVKERICVFYTSILILTDLRLFFWSLPSTSSSCKARNYRKILAMEIQILSRNYGHISQSLSKYFSYWVVSKSNNFAWFGTVQPWLKCLTTPVWSGTSNFSLLSLRIRIYRVDWNRSTSKSGAAQC